jgi:hypothetical protein
MIWSQTSIKPQRSGQQGDHTGIFKAREVNIFWEGISIMAKSIRDFSLALSDSIHAALESEAEAFNKTMQAVAREILQEWADRRHHAHTVYARRLRANGTQTELGGMTAGDDGMRRGGRK